MAAQQPGSIIVVTSVEKALSEPIEQHPNLHEAVVVNINPLPYLIQEVGLAALGGNNPAGDAYQVIEVKNFAEGVELWIDDIS